MTRNKRVSVYVRTKPSDNYAHDNINITNSNTINIHANRDPNMANAIVNNQRLDWSFRTDKVLHNSTQEQVFEEVGMSAVDSLLDGYNGTIMCYGQTGAGKTFTVTGATENFHHRGLIPRSLSYLFRQINSRVEYAYSVNISYLEIYNESIVDLLPDPDRQSPPSYTIMEDDEGIYVNGLMVHPSTDEEEALNLLFEGETNRSIGEHLLNKQSSRSHCIFTVQIDARARTKSDSRKLRSKLHFVDLAGSERLSKTKSAGKIQQEAMYINKSLLFLNQTVKRLSERKGSFIPFRQSKLTHFLKDSIGGKCSTVLIANIWPEYCHLEETISTLDFAREMMNVPSEPVLNEHHDPLVEVENLRREVEALKVELSMHDTLQNRQKINYEPLSRQRKAEIRQQAQQFLEGSIDDIEIINLRQVKEMFLSCRELYGALEEQIEQKLRDKFILVDKTDSEAILNAKSSGLLPQDFNIDQTGDLDKTTGFGIGVAPKGTKADKDSALIQQKKREATTGLKKRQKDGVKTPSKELEEKAGSSTNLGGKKSSKTAVEQNLSQEGSFVAATGQDEKQNQHGKGPADLRPSTPPSREQAFEEFKTGVGQELNSVLVENKAALVKKKKQFQETARLVNSSKSEIDDLVSKLDAFKAERQRDGFDYSGATEGELIITENESV